jgi:hypothetical protein
MTPGGPPSGHPTAGVGLVVAAGLEIQLPPALHGSILCLFEGVSGVHPGVLGTSLVLHHLSCQPQDRILVKCSAFMLALMTWGLCQASPPTQAVS